MSPMNVGGHFRAKGRDKKENNASWKRKLIGQGVVRRRAVELWVLSKPSKLEGYLPRKITSGCNH